MFLKRTSPSLLKPLAGDVEFGDTPVHEAIIAVIGDIKQSCYRGTYDGVYNPPSHHKRRIPFLEKAGQLILEALNNPFDFDLGHIFWHKDKLNKRGGYRKVRSEQRQSMTKRIGRFILHHVNLATQTLGHFVRELNDFHYYDYSYIAKMTGMNLSQIKRTMARFIREGYVSVEQRKKRLMDGSYRSLSPIIRISIKLFCDLGFDERLVMFHIEHSKKTLEKEKTKASRKDSDKPSLFQFSKTSDSKIARTAIAKIMESLAKKLNNNSS